jgi:hypothetical protein
LFSPNSSHPTAVCDTTSDDCTEKLPNDTFDLIVDKGTFDSVLCSTRETGGDGDGTTTTSEAVDQAAGEAMERAKAHPDPRQAPPFHSFGRHVRNVWRTLKQVRF